MRTYRNAWTVCAWLSVAACSGDDGGQDDADAAGVELSGPVSGGMGKIFSASVADLAARGYSESEFFFSGEAQAYTLPGGLTKDGKWTLAESSKAPFKSRLIVRRPTDATKFNGTVVIEWLNVSGGVDSDPGFVYNFDELLREGYAWVGVSAQSVGIEGGGFSLGPTGAVPLKMSDPERYGSLSHPGDMYSYDIYTKAAEIVHDADADPLKGLKPQRVIAYGESQSAARMVSYVNGVQPLAKQFDAFFIHSRSLGGAPFDINGGITDFIGGSPVLIRDDLQAKVVQFMTETDVAGTTGTSFAAARQPDSDRIRTWEVPGTAHADKYILDFNASQASGINCPAINDGPQRFVIRAALHELDAWIRNGSAPATAPLLTTSANGKLVRDEHGNALGGIRTPDVDVPIATLSGEPASGSADLLCILFGSTKPFAPELLMTLYPAHADYVAKVTASAAAARAAGFLLAPEEQAMVAKAAAAAVPN